MAQPPTRREAAQSDTCHLIAGSPTAAVIAHGGRVLSLSGGTLEPLQSL